MLDEVRILRDPEGKPLECIGYWIDITDRKKAETQVRELHEYLQLQIDRMPIALIVWDTEFRVKTWNPAATRMFGFSEEEALGKHPYDLIVPREAQHHVDEIWGRLLEGDETAHSENENTTKDGRTIICAWTNTPLKSSDGTVMGVLSMTRNITKRKRMEDRLNYLNRALSSIRKVNYLIVRERDRERPLKGACELLTETKGYLNACIALIDEDGAPASSACAETGELGDLLEGGELPPCIREAMDQPGVHVVEAPAPVCHGCPLEESLRGEARLMSRLEYEGKVYGFITVSAPEGMVGEEERSLFKEVCDDISYALHAMDVEEAKNHAEARVTELVHGLNEVAPGLCYLHNSHAKAYRIYADLTLHGVPGLCLAREDPEELVSEYGLTLESIILVSSRPFAGVEAVGDLQEISRTISRFLSDNEAPVVLLGGLEYLVSRFGFDPVYGFIQEKRFDFLDAGAVLLVPGDPATLSERERALLGSELKTLG